MSTFLDKSVILSPSICLLNGKCNLVITEMRFFPFYLINFVLVKMINIFSYNKGNFVATRSHRSWFILFEKIRSDHPNWYGELFRVYSRLNCLPIWYLLNCIKRISLLLIPNWVRPLLNNCYAIIILCEFLGCKLVINFRWNVHQSKIYLNLICTLIWTLKGVEGNTCCFVCIIVSEASNYVFTFGCEVPERVC